jgi:hypothetical protein
MFLPLIVWHLNMYIWTRKCLTHVVADQLGKVAQRKLAKNVRGDVRSGDTVPSRNGLSKTLTHYGSFA